jgi:soluble lytic murein transglycosylase
MAGMISLTRISRLALTAALLVPAAVHAGELTPEQMAWYRAQMGLAASAGPPPSTSSVGDAVMEWRRLTATNTASFDQVSRFLMANRDWPDADKLRVRAEKVDLAGQLRRPQRTLAYFQAYPRGPPAANCVMRSRSTQPAGATKPMRRCAVPGPAARSTSLKPIAF